MCARGYAPNKFKRRNNNEKNKTLLAFVAVLVLMITSVFALAACTGKHDGVIYGNYGLTARN